MVVIGMCLMLASSKTAFGQSGRVGWDGTWVGGWDRGAGVQVIFAGDSLIGFYLRDDYKEILHSSGSPNGGKTSVRVKGKAILTRTPDGGCRPSTRPA